ncbi:carboxypeptidase-like regulatory domain-containing protein [Mucilaginibacter sp. AW1-3]
MKTFSLSALLLLCCCVCFAQKPLTNSRTSSYYTYIYTLSDEDMKVFFEDTKKKPEDLVLNHPVDSVLTDRYVQPKLVPGNYLAVHATENKVSYNVIQVNTAYLQLLDNKKDLRFSLFDANGNEVTDAEAWLDHKQISYDPLFKLYHIKYHQKEDDDHYIKIKYKGVVSYYTVDQQERGRYGPSTWHNIINSRPIVYLWQPLANLFSKYHHGPYYGKGSPYNGFMAFNKPMYKPRDTVRFKAYIFQYKSKTPVKQKTLYIRLKEAYGDAGKIIGQVNSYRDGAFESSVVLNDSLKLVLDRNYTISLENSADVKAKNNVLISKNFRYEEYELKTITFNMRTNEEEQPFSTAATLYLKAADENELPVADGRIELILTAEDVQQYNDKHVFVPDTLWQHKLQLDPIGETKVLIPDSVFPMADVRYSVHAVFLNSNNERQTKDETLTFSAHKRYTITTKLNQDTLKITYLDKDRPVSAKARIIGSTVKGDTLLVKDVSLPAQIIINPNIDSYSIRTDSAYKSADMADFKDEISISSLRTADSLFVRVTNPHRIPFWYTVFSGNKIIDGGKAVNLFYKKPCQVNGNIHFLINYVWAGKPETKEEAIGYYDKLLTITPTQPISVYPGQTAPIVINVKDPAGKPVAGADVTAFAFTTKFKNYKGTSIPYFGKSYLARNLKERLEIDDKSEYGAFQLNWKRWGRQMGLDSIIYFQFTHPKDIYFINEPAPDSLTQIAPFVVKNGDILPIYVLFIDERPVYFSQAEQLQRYSFMVSPGRHKINFRTLNQDITLDKVFVAKGQKMILSVNADTALNHQAHFVKMPDTLTPYEAGLINKYMIRVVNNFGPRMATLTQENSLILLNPSPLSATNNTILTGPLSYNDALIDVKGGLTQSFITEPGYSYEFKPNFLKQKSIASLYPFNTHLGTSAPNYQRYLPNAPKDADIPSYSQYALTGKEVDTLWHHYLDSRRNTQSLFNNNYLNPYGNGKLVIGFDEYQGDHPDKHPPFIKNVVIYREGNPDYLGIYPGSTTDFRYLNPGNYRLLFLLDGDRYQLQEGISIKPNGINYYKVKFNRIKSRDSVSIKISTIIEQYLTDYQYADEDQQKLKIKEAFNHQYVDNTTFKDQMTGQVLDKNKQTLIGVSVIVNGTNHGTVTDINGRFRITVPPSGKLRIAYIGYVSTMEDIRPGTDVKIILAESSMSLNEVVVTGYGTRSMKSMSLASVSTLEGKVAGIDIAIRGAATPDASAKPLYVVDGVIVDSIDGVNAGDIADISTLKDAAGTAIYGARGASGVVIITTKKGSKNSTAGIELPGGQNTTRTNFRDYAYWQPRLITDEQGNARYNATFPDDITSWRTTAVAVSGKYTGYRDNLAIKAYKALSANMVTPQFAVKGDEMNVLGKMMNYTTDVAHVDRRFLYNGEPFKQNRLSVKNALIDTFRIVAADKDSLKFEYTIKKDNGYFDGERRSIPVFEQGVLETKGTFADLEKDTTVTLKFDPALGKVTFRAESSVLPALTEETDRLRIYEYLCNEQLASKLKGLLVEKRIRTYLGQPFKWDRNVLDLIKKLQENRRAEGTWGWWKDTEEELWISLHAVEALVDAEKEGYHTLIDKQKLIDYLMYQVTSYQGVNKLDAINILLKLNAKADYNQLIAVYEKGLSPKIKRSDYDKMKLMAVKQQAGLPIVMDSLLLKKRSTMFGNLYWGENDSYRFFDNSIQLSVMAYHILKADGKHPEMLIRLRNYFLEQRKDGYWRNTYESSLILETILPDLLIGKQTPAPPAITLNGDKNETVTQFPYTATLNPATSLKVSKTGVMPVYITGYQQFWNKQPVKVSKDFTVNTWFERSGNKTTLLKGGEPVSLQAEVTARADADFVMIEIPIPAGCSYESKEQPYWGAEVHREYFKNKVSIFCRKLKQGKYSFTIKLMPRYGGNYTLNPAKAEMMYFPVFYGREELKRVTIN